MEDREPFPALVTRASLGGVLMGLANLVPGISGGTMLLAAGVYPAFVKAVAELSLFRFRLRPLVLLTVISVGALAAIGLLAGPTKALVISHRWVMYSLFIGLTFGGVPLVWRMARPLTPAVVFGALAGFAVMAGMVFLRPGGGGGGGWLVLALAGAAGASAMILPGVSGAYLLLVLGQYERILGAVDQCKRGLGGDLGLIREAAQVVLPVGLGVIAGIVLVSNLVRWTLEHCEKATLGVLLGLLFGSVLGIWPFQAVVEEGGPKIYYAPGAGRIAAGLGLVLAGFAITLLIDRIGRTEPGSIVRVKDSH